MNFRAAGISGERLEILVFWLAAQRYALCLPEVKEVHRVVAITPLPTGPDVIEGVIDVRGELIPVMDLRKRLGRPEKPVQLSDHLILARADQRSVALRVDAVEGLVELEPGQVQSAREFASDAEYLAGIATLPDGLVLISDLHRFLSPGEATALDEALRVRRATENEE